MKNFKLLFCLFALIPFVSSCGSDDDDNDVTFDKNKVEIVVGQKTTVTIKRGEAPFTIVTPDNLVVTATVKDKEITIEGIKVGTVFITVTDKNKNTGRIAVTVVKDPYQEIKADPKTRLVYDAISKIEGTDIGAYSLTREGNNVAWNWVSENEEKTISLTFTTVLGPKATAPIKTDAKLIVDGKETKVDSLEVIKTDEDTIWVVFTIGTKEGVCVGKLSK